MKKKFSLKNRRVHHINHAIINNTNLENVSTSFSIFLGYLDLSGKVLLCRLSYAEVRSPRNNVGKV